MTELTFEVQPKVSIKLSEADIDDIMCAALEGGICYWCCQAKVVGEYLGEYAHEQIARGGTLKLYDAESDDVWELTREKFLNGVKLYAEQYRLPLMTDGCLNTSEIESRIDVFEIDGDAADCIVQLALFGEVVFG